MFALGAGGDIALQGLALSPALLGALGVEGTGLGSDVLQSMFTHWEVTQSTHFDEVAGVDVLFGGEVVEVSHVLILGRETQRRAISHPLPGTRGRGDTSMEPFHLVCELSRQGLWVQGTFLLASIACVGQQPAP